MKVTEVCQMRLDDVPSSRIDSGAHRLENWWFRLRALLPQEATKYKVKLSDCY